MSNIKLRLDGDPNNITLEAFITAVNGWFKLLKDVDTGISKLADGSLEWLVSNLYMGSLVVEATPVSKIEDKNYAPEVINTTINGLIKLEEDGLTPPYVTPSGLKTVRSMLKLIGNKGVYGIGIQNGAEKVILTARSSANVDQLLKIKRTSIGSVEGSLEEISIHQKKPRYVIYHHLTRKAVTCNFDREALEEIKDALGERVIVSGVVYYNAKNEPVRVEQSNLQKMKPKNKIPSIADISGSDPYFTGDFSTEDYIRSIRSE